VDKGQDPETQLLALREYVVHRGFICVGEYVEYASGTREDRPRYRALLEATRKRQTVKAHCRGYVELIRYADDTLLVFEREDDAQQVMRVLPLRLATFGLRLNAQKTRLVPFGKRARWRALNAGQRPPTLDFLGLTHDWGRSRRGLVRLKRKTSKKRLRRALVAINQ
jgi:hypothetical protein